MKKPVKIDWRRQILLWGFAVVFGGLATLTVLFARTATDSSNIDFAFEYISLKNLLVFLVSTVFARWAVEIFEKKVRKLNFFEEKREKTVRKKSSLKNFLKKVETPKHFFLVTFILTLISFGIMLVLLFPGTMMNDTTSSIFFAYTDANHPLIFQAILNTLFNFFYWLTGRAGVSIAGITFLQIFCGALVWAYLVRWLRARGVRKGICWAVAIFACCFPVASHYSVAILKDTWFAYSLLLFLPTSFAVLFDRKPTRIAKVLFVVSALACSLVRTNGKYVVIATLSIMLIYALAKKLNRRIVLVLGLGLVILAQIVNSQTIDALGMRRTGVRESLSVPLAQIAAVVYEYDAEIPEEVIAPDDQEFLAQILPLKIWAEDYCYSFVDKLKFDVEFDKDFLDENWQEFLAVWARTLAKKPKTFLSAYLAQTYGMWNLAFADVATYDRTQSIFLDVANNTGGEAWMAERYGEEYAVSSHVLFLSREEGKVIYAGLSYVVKACFVLTCGMMILFMLLTAVLLLTWRQGKLILALLPLLFTWGTMMVSSPASMIYRYYIFLVFALPFVFFVLFYGNRERKKAAKLKVKD